METANYKSKTLSSITIQTATVAQTADIANLSRITFYDTYAQFNTKENMDQFITEHFSIAALTSQINDHNNIFLIAYMDNQPVGYVKMREGKIPEGLGEEKAIEIERIYALKNVIGQGVGKSLMLESIATAKAKGKKMIWLGVWQQNSSALQFYKKFGFKEFGTHIFMLGEDPQTDFLMRKMI
ncbi:MAG: GNAT family N-acetyltransferase [Bacteroidetes bacterium]|nr:GNAT family N-acetyltransferase [Bacteroidota bacterium]